MVEVKAPVAPAVSEAPIAPVPSRSGWVKPMVAIAAFAVILTLVSSGAVLLLGGPSPATYPAGTPSAAFQDFVNAAKKGDWATADGLISANLRSQGLTSQSVAGIVATTDVIVSIDSSHQDGSRATLDVTYQFSSGGVFSNSGLFSGSGVLMVLEPGGWKVDSQLMIGY